MSTGSKGRLAVRAYNRIVGAYSMLRPRRRFRDHVEELRERARRDVGWDDFGDPFHAQALDVLVRAYDEEARFTPFGRSMASGQIAAILRNRLIASRSFAEHPEVLEPPVRRPLFILGLPRTGTTALHFLAAQDPEVQSLEYWLGAAPKPRPPRHTWPHDPAFKRAVRELKTMYWLDPGLAAIHLMTADGPDECRHLLSQSFADDGFDCNATVPSYADWYDSLDMRVPYTEHKRLLQLIGSSAPEKRWVLKYPAHIRNLTTIFEVYPDACVVQCHRDPAKVLPSICSLVAGWRALSEGQVDRTLIGRRMLDLWGRSMDRGMAARDALDPKSFFDLDFRDVLGDPVAALRRVYDHFGFAMTDDAEKQLRLWNAANPREKHGRHEYAADDYGLTEEGIQERFAAYFERFGAARGV